MFFQYNFPSTTNQFQTNIVLHRTYKRSIERSSPIYDAASEPHCFVRLVRRVVAGNITQRAIRVCRYS